MRKNRQLLTSSRVTPKMTPQPTRRSPSISGCRRRGGKFSVLVTSKAVLANYHRVREAMAILGYNILAVDGSHRLVDVEFPSMVYGILDAAGKFHLLGIGLAESENAETVASQLKALKVQYRQCFPEKPEMMFEMAMRDASQAIHNGVESARRARGARVGRATASSLNTIRQTRMTRGKSCSGVVGPTMCVTNATWVGLSWSVICATAASTRHA